MRVHGAVVHAVVDRYDAQPSTDLERDPADATRLGQPVALVLAHLVEDRVAGDLPVSRRLLRM